MSHLRKKKSSHPCAEKYGLDLISLIAPTSHERISMIAKEAEGFVYCVSSLGVTGMRSQITTDIGAMVELVKAQKDIPCAVGFRNLHSGAGQKDGLPGRRRHRRLRYCQTLRNPRHRLRTVHQRVCEVHEGCDKIKAYIMYRKLFS